MAKAAKDNLEEVVHGGLDFAELEALGLEAAEIIDFSVNSNPYGPSPLVRAALAQFAIDRYPDRQCLALKRAILEFDVPGSGLAMANLLCGNGASELIWAVARTFLKSGLQAGVVGPTFGEYRAASLAAGAIVREYRTRPATVFRLDLGAFCHWLHNENLELLWLCNPNNPAGYWLQEPELLEIARICRAREIVLVIDEAYQRFLLAETRPPFSTLDWVNDKKNNDLPVIVLRSLTKDYALAGLRLGYIAARPEFIERVAGQLSAWNVNGAAQAAGVAALSDQLHLARTLALLKKDRQELFNELAGCGLAVIDSSTHYCLIKTGQADGVRRQLLRSRLLVRSGTSFGLPDYIRIAARPAADRVRLINELELLKLTG